MVGSSNEIRGTSRWRQFTGNPERESVTRSGLTETERLIELDANFTAILLRVTDPRSVQETAHDAMPWALAADAEHRPYFSAFLIRNFPSSLPVLA